jgi:hypothetical protein
VDQGNRGGLNLLTREARPRAFLRNTRAARLAWRAAAPNVIAIALYALAMAYVEAADVLYLRTIYGGVDPVGPRQTPFNPIPDFVWIEIGREAATMVMLASVAYLAARTPLGRLGAFAVAMGLWDIGYYAFLWLFSGWPDSLLAPDVLFLIPLPWWGPVLSPLLVAAIVALAGAAVMSRERGDGVPRPGRRAILAIVLGAAICLIAFMWGALAALPNGIEAAYYTRGGPFPWPLFLVGVAIGTYGLWRVLIRSTVYRD